LGLIFALTVAEFCESGCLDSVVAFEMWFNGKIDLLQ